jgi:hypothetical protein
VVTSSGQWLVVSGQWLAVSGQWSVVSGCWVIMVSEANGGRFSEDIFFFELTQ